MVSPVEWASQTVKTDYMKIGKGESKDLEKPFSYLQGKHCYQTPIYHFYMIYLHKCQKHSSLYTQLKT